MTTPMLFGKYVDFIDQYADVEKDARDELQSEKHKTITMNNNCKKYKGYVSREDREKLHGYKGALIWFTGLSASGKSTIANLLEKRLHDMGCSAYVLDGENLRRGLCSDLGFLEQDRAENNRRIREMYQLTENNMKLSLIFEEDNE